MLSDLNQRADFLAQTRTPDGAGGFSESWDVFASVWCALSAGAATDSFGPDKLESDARYRIEIRRRTDIAAGHRVAVGTRLFAVHAVLDEGPNRPRVTLMCEELP